MQFNNNVLGGGFPYLENRANRGFVSTTVRSGANRGNPGEGEKTLGVLVLLGRIFAAVCRCGFRLATGFLTEAESSERGTAGSSLGWATGSSCRKQSLRLNDRE